MYDKAIANLQLARDSVNIKIIQFFLLKLKFYYSWPEVIFKVMIKKIKHFVLLGLGHKE